MPTEERFITFNDRETREAILMLLAANQTDILDEIEDVRLGDGTTATVACTRRPAIKLTERALTDALMRYCQARRVPLPQRGLKSLRRDEAGLTLVIKLADAPFATQLNEAAQ